LKKQGAIEKTGGVKIKHLSLRIKKMENKISYEGLFSIILPKECRVWTIKDNYRLGDDIQSKVLAFAFGLSAEIERNLISQRTNEALARKKAEGVILGRPKGRKSSPEKHKLFGKEVLIKELLKENISRRKIATICKVDRNTLSRYLKSIIYALE
jgi:DNA invertase Pin-like site-specific DNA recombinase